MYLDVIPPIPIDYRFTVFLLYGIHGHGLFPLLHLNLILNINWKIISYQIIQMLWNAQINFANIVTLSDQCSRYLVCNYMCSLGHQDLANKCMYVTILCLFSSLWGQWEDSFGYTGPPISFFCQCNIVYCTCTRWNWKNTYLLIKKYNHHNYKMMLKWLSLIVRYFWNKLDSLYFL